jgi:hypothetical protein
MSEAFMEYLWFRIGMMALLLWVVLVAGGA